MFGLFSKPTTFNDPALGQFAFVKGKWRGQGGLAGQNVPLFIAGSKQAPDAACIDLARELGKIYVSLQDTIRHALYEHFEPYADHASVKVANDDTLWPHARALGVVVEPQDGIPTIEIAYAVDWDEEHTPGARIQHGKLAELNGSILSPF